jgi:hypothetical protein
LNQGSAPTCKLSNNYITGWCAHKLISCKWQVEPGVCSNLQKQQQQIGQQQQLKWLQAHQQQKVYPGICYNLHMQWQQEIRQQQQQQQQ